jgi:hypothetical protein
VQQHDQLTIRRPGGERAELQPANAQPSPRDLGHPATENR